MSTRKTGPKFSKTEKDDEITDLGKALENMKVRQLYRQGTNKRYPLILAVQELLITDDDRLLSEKNRTLKRKIKEEGIMRDEVVYDVDDNERKRIISFIYNKVAVNDKKDIVEKFGIPEKELVEIFNSIDKKKTKGLRPPREIFIDQHPVMAEVAEDEKDEELPMAEAVEEEDEVPEAEKIDPREEEAPRGTDFDFKGKLEFRTQEEHGGMLDASLDTKESHRKFVKGTNEDNEEFLVAPIVGEDTGKTLELEPTPDELIAEEEETGGYEFTEESRGSSETVTVVPEPILTPPELRRTDPEPEILAPPGYTGGGLSDASTVGVGSLFDTVDGTTRAAVDTRAELDTIPEFVGDEPDEEETIKEPDQEFGTFYTDQKQLKFEVKYHKVQFKMFFGALNNPNIDKVLFKNIMESVETGLLTRESVKELCEMILTVSKGEFLVKSVVKGDLQELHELSQLYFCLHRDLMTGPRMPMGRVPLSQLTNLSKMIQSPTEQFDTATGVPILPQQEEVQQVPSILTPQEIERRSRMVQDELGISRPASIFSDIARNVRAHNKKEIKIVQEPNLKIQATDIAIRDTSAYSHLKINFKRDSKE